MTDALFAVSPLSGRYEAQTSPLQEYASEAALMRARLQVEVEYLVALADCAATPLELTAENRTGLRSTYESFDADDAARIKQIETEGTESRPATNHDVKAIEYFLREELEALGLGSSGPWVHFALTSEDVNNLAHRLLVSGAVEDVLVPELNTVQTELAELADSYRGVAMLARTHGQPATPTTFGKEMAVYATRLERGIQRLTEETNRLAGKLGGASGSYAAHVAAYPDVDWPTVAREFVESLGLEFVAPTTQVNPCDDLAGVFDAVRGVNSVLLDLDRDAWRYISDRYLGQEATSGETGSSTMPHKVNPIDFENSEGNLSKANSDLVFLGEYITTSRLQRDLSDSTVKRNIGSALAHCLLGYTKLQTGLSKVVPNEEVMREELAETPEVIGEAVQTILRREGQADAYERVKELTRGQDVTLEEFRELFDDLAVDESVREELRALTPAGYTGVGSELVEEQ